MKHPDLIVPHFERADVRLKQVHAVSHIYNYPWDNDQVGLPRLTINNRVASTSLGTTSLKLLPPHGDVAQSHIR